eukprot:6204029-Pleurochrysis_carterae.AAC.1
MKRALGLATWARPNIAERRCRFFRYCCSGNVRIVLRRAGKDTKEFPTLWNGDQAGLAVQRVVGWRTRARRQRRCLGTDEAARPMKHIHLLGARTSPKQNRPSLNPQRSAAAGRQGSGARGERTDSAREQRSRMGARCMRWPGQSAPLCRHQHVYGSLQGPNGRH